MSQHTVFRNPKHTAQWHISEAVNALGPAAPLSPKQTDLVASNVAKFLQETHDEAASECRTIGRAIEINANRNPAKVNNLTSRREKYVAMQARADHLLSQPLDVILGLLKGQLVSRTSIRALCEKDHE